MRRNRCAVTRPEDLRQVLEMARFKECGRRNRNAEEARNAAHDLGDGDGIDAVVGEVLVGINAVLRHAQSGRGEAQHILLQTIAVALLAYGRVRRVAVGSAQLLTASLRPGALDQLALQHRPAFWLAGSRSLRARPSAKRNRPRACRDTYASAPAASTDRPPTDGGRTARTDPGPDPGCRSSWRAEKLRARASARNKARA